MRKAPQPPPFRLAGIEHVLLLVNNLEEALAFYEGALGATVESRLPKHAMVELRVGSSHLDLVDVSVSEGAWAAPPVAGGRNVDHVAVRVDAPDKNALRRHLTERSVEIFEERIEEPDGGVSFYVRDPSGNVVELMT